MVDEAGCGPGRNANAESLVQAEDEGEVILALGGFSIATGGCTLSSKTKKPPIGERLYLLPSKLVRQQTQVSINEVLQR